VCYFTISHSFVGRNDGWEIIPRLERANKVSSALGGQIKASSALGIESKCYIWRE